jgi:aminoglycoside phosphotransferase (APT) family kinase protein
MAAYEEFIGTMPVAEKQRFDEAALAAYLRDHVEGYSGELTVEQFKGGQSNPTYKLTAGGKSYAMRAKPGPAAKLLPSAHAVDREFRVITALGKAGIPVPRTYCLCEDEGVIGRAFYVMDCVEGRVLWEQSLPGCTNAQRGEIYDEMNRVIAALHTVDYAKIGLADYGKPGNYFERQIGRWSKQYQASVTESIASMDALMAWLPANIPESARDATQVSVVHGDFRLDNLMFHPTEARILAVLDWELSTIGHPLADFSYHCMSWHIPPGAFRGIGGLDLAALGIPDEKSYVRRYCERTGRKAPGAAEAVMGDWNFYMAYNLFRLAAILQGIVRRARDGTAASSQAAQSGAGTRQLADMGWQFAQSA